jgi:hypothetical protein
MSDYRCFPDPEGAENTINFPPLFILLFFIFLGFKLGYKNLVNISKNLP